MQKKFDMVIIYGLYGIGGAQRRAHNLANEFAKKGYSVTILSLFGNDGSVEGNDYYKDSKNVSFVLLPDFIEKNKTDADYLLSVKKSKTKIKKLKIIREVFKKLPCINETTSNSIRGFRKSADLKYFLSFHKKSTVISFGFNIFEISYYAAKANKCRIVYAETNASDKYINDYNFKATSECINRADICVFQTKEEMRFLNSADKKNSFVIHNPINTALPEPYIGERKKIIVNFCRIVPQKNLMLLIKAFERFMIEYPDYKLQIFGDVPSGSEPYYNSLSEYIRTNNLSQSIEMLNATRDIHHIIRDYSMFVSSSDYEGISNSMIEALALGLPCVCTDCKGGGAAEIIKDGKNGLLTPLGDEISLYKAMKDMTENVELAERCSRNAYQIKEKLSIHEISEQWLKVLNL